MEFDFDKFLDRLQKTVVTRQETVRSIYEEIRLAESQKVRFLDQAKENPAFYTYLSSQVDNYIVYLKVLHNRIAQEKTVLAIDEQVYQTDESIINRTMLLVKQLEEVENNRIGGDLDDQQDSNLNITSTDL